MASWNPVKWIAAAVKWLTGWADRIAPLVNRIADVALPIVAMIAAETPTRKDDEFIAFFQKYGLKWTQEWVALPLEKRGAILLDAATQLVAREFPGVNISILQAAIQLALVQFRAKDQQSADALMGTFAGSQV